MSTALKQELARCDDGTGSRRAVVVESAIVVVDDEGNEEPYVPGEL